MNTGGSIEYVVNQLEMAARVDEDLAKHLNLDYPVKLNRQALNAITALRTQNTELQRQVAERDAALKVISSGELPDGTGVDVIVSAYAEQAIQPSSNVLELVGYATEASMTNLINGNDVIIGTKNDLRTEPLYRLKDK